MIIARLSKFRIEVKIKRMGVGLKGRVSRVKGRGKLRIRGIRASVREVMRIRRIDFFIWGIFVVFFIVGLGFGWDNRIII